MGLSKRAWKTKINQIMSDLIEDGLEKLEFDGTLNRYEQDCIRRSLGHFWSDLKPQKPKTVSKLIKKGAKNAPASWIAKVLKHHLHPRSQLTGRLEGASDVSLTQGYHSGEVSGKTISGGSSS